MLLMNMKKIKETGLLEKAREKIKTKKMLFADQDAIYRSTTKKLLLPRKYNEQSSFKRKDTVICHFCKRLMLLPYPHTENYIGHRSSLFFLILIPQQTRYYP